MKYINNKLWKSSYLLELVDDQNQIFDAIAFSVPPQSEEFVYPYRINETKTFGGSIIAEYGNDLVQIKLSGSTINQDMKIIYRSTYADKEYLTGEEEVFRIQKIIEDYSKIRMSNKRINLYSLESRDYFNGNKDKAWRIWINDFQIRRSKEQPNTYFYTLDAIGTPLNINYKGAYDQLIGKSKLARNIYEYAKVLQDKIDKLKNSFADLIEYFQTVKDFADLIEVAANATGDALTACYDYVMLVNNFGFNTALPIMDAVITLEKKTISRSTKFGLQNYVNDNISKFYQCVDSIDKMTTYWKEFKKTDSFKKQYVNESIDGDTAQEKIDKFDYVIKNLEYNIDEATAIINKFFGANTVIPVVIPGQGEDDDEIIIADGFSEYFYHSGDTWVDISQKFYNSTDYASMLQLYNDGIDLAEIDSGAKIYIPNINQNTELFSQNEVYNKIGTKDIYGSDLKIDDKGDIAFKNNDFESVNGNSNVTQAILNRLSTVIGTRVRNVIYGIRATSGIPATESQVLQKYITYSINQTLLADSRIKEIKTINWRSNDGNIIKVNVVYTTIDGGTFNNSVTV